MRVVTVARKPLAGSVAKNTLEQGCGGLNIDACRISTSHPPKTTHAPGWDSLNAKNASEGYRPGAYQQGGAEYNPHARGRWPSNVVLVHPGCMRAGQMEVRGYTINRWDDGAKPFGGGAGKPFTSEEQGPETVDVWVCRDGCPAVDVDHQSGVSNSIPRSAKGEGEHLDPSREGWRFRRQAGGFTDAGGASRFFKQVQGEPCE